MNTLPSDFIQQMQALIGNDETEQLCQALDTASPVSIRTNAQKNSRCNEVEVPWCFTGHYLPQRPAFTFDPLFHAGAYYVQEASSMFIEQAFRTFSNGTPLRLLDLCAAPGGKSTLWRSLLPEGSFFVANEPLRGRAVVLAENLQKWGNPDVAVTCAFPKEFAPLNGFFDVIAADVPCSGEGMFRKDADAIGEWSLQNVKLCAERQREIINDIWPALKTGGYLVYSTCTFNTSEDEDNVQWICRELGAELVPIATQPAWNVKGSTGDSSLPVYHFFPHHAQGEGFFLALLRKTSENEQAGKRKVRPFKEQPVSKACDCRNWLTEPETWRYFRTPQNIIAALRKELFPDFEALRSAVRIVTAGVELAEEKGHKNIPQHALALSTALAPTTFPTAEVSYDEALTYLRRGNLVLSAAVPRGYVIITYRNHPLGFVNNLGTRTNNLYPQEWKILSSFNPEEPVNIVE